MFTANIYYPNRKWILSPIRRIYIQTGSCVLIFLATLSHYLFNHTPFYLSPIHLTICLISILVFLLLVLKFRKEFFNARNILDGEFLSQLTFHRDMLIIGNKSIHMEEISGLYIEINDYKKKGVYGINNLLNIKTESASKNIRFELKSRRDTIRFIKTLSKLRQSGMLFQVKIDEELYPTLSPYFTPESFWKKVRIS